MGGRRAIRRLREMLPETAVVQDMTPEGQGLVTLGGKRVFVDGALTGETVSLRRVRSRRNYDEADLLAVIEASAERVAPRCAWFGTCGGCTLQHLSRSAQLTLKQSVLEGNLLRIGRVTPQRWLEPVTGESWGYRRRARLSVRHVEAKGRVLVGFSERGSPYVTDMLGCETLHPAAAALIEPLSALIGMLSLRQRIPQVEVAVADTAVALVLRVLETPTAMDLDHLRAFRDRHGLRLWLQHSGSAGLAPLDAGRDDGPLSYRLDGGALTLGFGPTDFIQVNAGVNERLLALAIDLLAPEPGQHLLDLYCGIGNFTLPFARRAGSVLGIEGGAAAVARARSNAAANGIANAEFRCADLATAQAGDAWGGARFDAVLLDPPRAGAAAVLDRVVACGAARILYVSCHPGTLARDAGVLVHDHGLHLAAAGILDMFPATSHVESVALFERR
ncbi:MAG: 23S rRNA (uracil(1939)-C(5))-methyltransferase RlmD [Gammaproteobacteria bacterium]|nr:23S rRNA (uracil(1939)-C(5))-methyltransferase RlmD [Gammaproteobacteria bacterium]